MAFDNIRIEKNMYNVPGKSFTQVLEELDPSENYAGTQYEGLDAFQRQLKRFDIKVSGPNSDAVAKFYSTADSSALFPEYVSRAVRSGITESPLVKDIVASTTYTDSLNYRSFAATTDLNPKTASAVAEGTALPTVTISLKEKAVALKKYGRTIEASYEAMKFQRLDMFSLALRQVGDFIAKQRFANAIDVIKNGDGNSNPAAVVTGASATSVSYDDMLSLWSALGDFKMNTIIASPDMALKLIKIYELQDRDIGIDFQYNGKFGTPFGANFIKSDLVGEKTIIALDKRYALEMVIASDVLVEYENSIVDQMTKATVSSISGFAKMYDGASVVYQLKQTA